MEKILVNLSTDHIFESHTNILGREGEGNTAHFELTIPEKLRTCSLYLDFKKPNGEKLRTPKLEIENGVARYDVVPYILTDEGEIQVQAVLKTTRGGTWKTTIKKYHNHNSINAEDYIDEELEKIDFISEAQKVLDELSGEVNEIATILSNNTKFVDNIINRVEEINIEEVDALQEDVDALGEDIEAIEGDIEALGGDIEALEGGIDTLQGNLVNIRDELASDIQENANDIKINRNAISINTNLINSLSNPIFRIAGSIEFTNGYGDYDFDFKNSLMNKICFVRYVAKNTYTNYTGAMIVTNGARLAFASDFYLEFANASISIKDDSGNDSTLHGNGTAYFYVLGTIGEALQTFTIDGKTYQFEGNETWYQWVNSVHNDGTVYLLSGNVYYRASAVADNNGDIKVVFVNSNGTQYDVQQSYSISSYTQYKTVSATTTN